MSSAADKRDSRLASLHSTFTILNSTLLGMRLWHWLWVLLCVAGALAVAAPRVLSQPVVYYATAQTQFDVARYGGLYSPVAPGRTGLDVAMGDALEVLRQDALARRELRFGLPSFQVTYIPAAEGTVLVRGVATTAAEAQALADAGAAELVRQVRAAGGREILRNMLGWELWLSLDQRDAALGPFDLLLREIIRTQAFPMSRELEPVSTPRDVASMPREEQLDMARALEARYDLWRFAINTRNATLDALCASAGLPAREQALASCADTSPQASAELDERDRSVARLRAIDAALQYMIREQGAAFHVDAPGAAQRVMAALPAAPEPRYIPQLIALAALFGLAFGAAGVAVDRSAHLMAKAEELWRYRELIRNLVLRDLRARYKGSALGYLWTQLAPLGMMLVYVLVFSVLMPVGVAQFPVFIIVGLLPWNYTAEAVMSGTRSIIDNSALIKKVYFPREVLPLVSVLSSLTNFVLSLPMMFVVMALIQLMTMGRLNLAWSIAYLPVLIVVQTVMLAGISMLLGAVAVFFRDVVHLVGIVVNIWFFLTPVIYPLSNFGDGVAVRLLRWLNPMASLIEFYRESLYGAAVAVGQIPTPGVPALSSLLRVGVTALVVLVAGYWVFERTSGRFGEEI
ncbi:ABC transporter permease [Oscillochloris sp. ZM17-4]|uniref:ABC transporter permease n=1 Tax=Oscillochloris sp. ZM17-4 TaxID=2866714 RepID=UPI001C72CBEA|nr:ABC transporter permease [Oscillochloris sp. ZM17-4]MBX0327336.1 ABC transporter permease [Oscillochloris sp. ZM17-4]